MVDIKYRQAGYEDIDGIYDLYKELIKLHRDNEPDFFNKENQSKHFIRDVLNDNFAIIYVAVVDSKIVGFVLLQIEQTINLVFLKKYRTLYLTDLFVLEDYQNNGIGSHLIDLSINYATKHKLQYIELDVWSFNQKAIDMYLRRGFKNKLNAMYLKL